MVDSISFIKNTSKASLVLSAHTTVHIETDIVMNHVSVSGWSSSRFAHLTYPRPGKRYTLTNGSDRPLMSRGRRLTAWITCTLSVLS